MVKNMMDTTLMTKKMVMEYFSGQMVSHIFKKFA